MAKISKVNGGQAAEMTMEISSNERYAPGKRLHLAWRIEGECPKGEDCKDVHYGGGLCKYWSANGTCPNGPSCAYAHPGSYREVDRQKRWHRKNKTFKLAKGWKKPKDRAEQSTSQSSGARTVTVPPADAAAIHSFALLAMCIQA